jgi:hypothetical protein
MSSLMPLRTGFITLLRAKLQWFRIEKVTFYTLRTIMGIKLEEFMLENIIIFLIMLLCIIMKCLALGIQLILKCLKKIANASSLLNTFYQYYCEFDLHKLSLKQACLLVELL